MSSNKIDELLSASKDLKSCYSHYGLKILKESKHLETPEYTKNQQARDRLSEIKKQGKAIKALIELLKNCSENDNVSELVKGNPIFDNFLQRSGRIQPLGNHSELEKNSQDDFAFPFLIQDQNSSETFAESTEDQQPSNIPKVIVKSEEAQDFHPLTIETCRPQILSSLPDDYDELSKKARSLEGQVLNIVKEISRLKRTATQPIEESHAASSQHLRKEAQEQIQGLEKKLLYIEFYLKHARAKIRDSLSSFSKGNRLLQKKETLDSLMESGNAREELLKKIRSLSESQLKAMMEIQVLEQQLNEPFSPIAASQLRRKEVEEHIKKLEEKIDQNRVSLEQAYAKMIEMFNCSPIAIYSSHNLKRKNPTAHE